MNRVMSIFISGIATLALAGCGGGGGDDNNAVVPVATYTISAMAHSGGTISPASITVNEGETASFTLTVDYGYEHAGANGCGGVLNGDIYTTSAITADCNIEAGFHALTSMAITDIYVYNSDGGGPLPGPEYVSLPLCNGSSSPDCHDGGTGWNIMHNLGSGPLISLWMKQEEVAEASGSTVVTDVLVNHWSSNDAWAVSCPAGYQPANGNSLLQAGLNPGTPGSCNKLGLCVRTAAMQDTSINRPLATLNISQDNNPRIMSPDIATAAGHLSPDGQGYGRVAYSRDLHEGCGDDYWWHLVSYKTEPDPALLPKPEMDVVLNPVTVPSSAAVIELDENGYPLDYHSIVGNRTEHLQAMIRLPDANGNQYYMGTYSQDCDNNDCGLVFVGEVVGGSSDECQGMLVDPFIPVLPCVRGKVIWADFLNGQHPALGINHPGDLHRIGNYVIVAGQNWDGGTWFNLGLGGGGQGVLFYDVSNPASPQYVGKMNSCWRGNQVVAHNGDIDTIGAAKIGDSYYISFNGLRCKSQTFHPLGRWDVVTTSGGPADSPVKFEYGGNTYVGTAGVGTTNIAWNGFSDEFVSLTQILNTPKINYDYDEDAKSLSTLPDGRYCTISTNVESDTAVWFTMQCN